MPTKGRDDNLDIHELWDYAESDPHDDHVAKTKGGTSADLQDMQRMGRVQELRVRCGLPSEVTTLSDADIFRSVTSNLSALLDL